MASRGMKAYRSATCNTHSSVWKFWSLQIKNMPENWLSLGSLAHFDKVIFGIDTAEIYYISFRFSVWLKLCKPFIIPFRRTPCIYTRPPHFRGQEYLSSFEVFLFEIMSEARDRSGSRHKMSVGYLRNYYCAICRPWPAPWQWFPTERYLILGEKLSENKTPLIGRQVFSRLWSSFSILIFIDIVTWPIREESPKYKTVVEDRGPV